MPRSTSSRPSDSLARVLAAVLITALLLPMLGCGFLSHAMYWVRGNPVSAKFPGLKKKTVAVVCLDANSAGPSPETDQIAEIIGQKLAMNGDQINVIPQQKVFEWMDSQADNVDDFRAIGKGLKADMVVGVEIEGFQTNDGPTLLRGRARTVVKVFDMNEGGKIVYQTQPQQIVYPSDGSRPVGDNEFVFKRIFIDEVSRRIAKDFYVYQQQEDFGNDARFSGG